LSTDSRRKANHPSHPRASNRGLGLILFALYLVLYSGFVALNTFWPQAAGKAVFGGINLAIVYGLGLIIAAIVLALVYAFLCAPGEEGAEE